MMIRRRESSIARALCRWSISARVLRTPLALCEIRMLLCRLGALTGLAFLFLHFYASGVIRPGSLARPYFAAASSAVRLVQLEDAPGDRR
ncbi:MAG: hypothetical protein JWO48_348 [Bryobacterales bacterium]|nr:hypothetical protein [Bryobacterales bacterium]